MRLLILGSVALPVPPSFQGGTEWMAYFQANGLAQRGHTVTLVASHGSKPGPYRLIEVGKGDTVVGTTSQVSPSILSSWQATAGARPGSERILSDSGQAGMTDKSTAVSESPIVESSRPLRKETVYLSEVMQILLDQKDSYDIILNNMRGEAVFVPVARLLGKPFASVCHLPLFTELAEFFRQNNTHVITISDAQRKQYPDLSYLATVYNGVNIEEYSYNDNPNEYLLMMGSIARHKNQAAAVRVAKKLHMKLVLAGKINDPKYFQELAPDIDGEQIRHVGEIGFEEKLTLYRQAKAFLFPIQWPEPFGLVMIEAQSCGTPVVAYGNGAIPEVVVDGKTGYIVSPDRSLLSDLGNLGDLKITKHGEDGLADAIRTIMAMPQEEYRRMRRACRSHVEQKFTVEKMVEGYEKALMNL